MAKQVSITGNVNVEPPNGVPGNGGDFPLQLAALALTRCRLDTIDLAASTPVDLAASASVVGIRPPADVVLTLDTPAGTGQVVTVPANGLAMLWSPDGGFANVSLQAAVDVSGVEILVG